MSVLYALHTFRTVLYDEFEVVICVYEHHLRMRTTTVHHCSPTNPFCEKILLTTNSDSIHSIPLLVDARRMMKGRSLLPLVQT